MAETLVCEEILAEHTERLNDLKELVSQIAADVGLDASGLLQGEVEALGRRLEDIRESLTTLADVAETRAQNNDACSEDLNNARTFLNTVQKSLSEVGESNETEEQLIALRNHLLALGKTEGQIQNAKEKSLEITETRTETSVIEILQLWQKVFQETFQQYHRLSTKLVKGEDGAAALRLWQEYLLHMQTFLSSSIPEDYHGLMEHQHLCEVHQNLLATQQNVLLSKTNKSDASAQLGGGVGDTIIAEQFNTLTNLHNETLSRIIQRHGEVRERLDAWDKYRADQSKLLQWLKDMEKERGRLQLRYIHVRRVSKVLSRIKSLLDKVPSGEEQAQNLQKQQTKLLEFCDDALATSIRMEHAAITKRISNLQAALLTWKEFLERVLELAKTYDDQVIKVQAVFHNTQQVITMNVHDVPVSHSGIQNRLESLRSLRDRLLEQTKELEDLTVIQEQLKECVSPADMKTINQRLWLLRQQQGDLGHQLAVLCHNLQEKLGLRNLFDTRQKRFIAWATELENRLDKESETESLVQDPEELLRKLESELQAEIALKDREVEWLLTTGEELIQGCGNEEGDSAHKQQIQAKVDEVRERWQFLQNLGKTKTSKIHDMLQTMSQLEIRIAEIRVWLSQIEIELATPLVLDTFDKDVVDNKIQEHDVLRKRIEQESGEIGEVLNLCELLLNDVDVWSAHISTETITSAVENIEKRWKLVCGNSAERKRRILTVWTLLQEVIRLTSEQQEWLKAREAILSQYESVSDVPRQQIQDIIYKVENEVKEIESRSPAFEIIEQTYSKLAKDSGLEPQNLQQLTADVKNILKRWYALTPRTTDLLQRLQRELTLYREFASAHGQAVVNLTQVDIRLTQLQHLATPEQAASPKHQLKAIEDLETQLRSQKNILETADKLGLMLMQKGHPEDIASIQEMIDEYQLLWADIETRLTALKVQVQQQVLEMERVEVDESVQVETLKFEQDSAVQVNTLPPLVRLTSITPKDAYSHELEAAIQECTSSIESLEAIVESAIPQQGSPEIQTSGRTLAKLIAACQSSTELIRHLNSLLVTECRATDEEAKTDLVQSLLAKYDELLVRAKARESKIRELREAGRLLCPLCTKRNWQQLDNDLWRLEKWLECAEGVQSAQHSPPSNIEQLEDVIQDHRELWLDLDSHKSIVASLNIVGTHLADHTEDVARADQLRERLVVVNKRWDSVCKNAIKWQNQLQHALMDNRQFHRTIEELCAWLENTEATIKASEPVDLTADVSVIEAKFQKFGELRSELEKCEPRVMSLQEAADQLFKDTEAPEGSASICTRLTDLRLRLQSLRKLTGLYLLKLGAVLGRDPNEIITMAAPTSGIGASLHSLSYDLLDQASTSEFERAASTDEQLNGAGGDDDDDINTSVLRRSYRFLGRVVRASLPIQALMLLLLGVASLIPTTQEDYSCNLANNYARSLEPMLRYPNGPPPI